MPKFVLMLRDETWNPEDLSAEEIGAVLRSYRDWLTRIGGQGNKLRDNEGKVLRRNGKGFSVTDGPYAEVKEVMGGFLTVEAKDYDAAVRLCEGSPHFRFGSIEIRQLEEIGG